MPMLLGPQVLYYPLVLDQEGYPCPRYQTFLITPLSSTRKGALAQDRTFPRKSLLHPPVLKQEGILCFLRGAILGPIF